MSTTFQNWFNKKLKKSLDATDTFYDSEMTDDDIMVFLKSSISWAKGIAKGNTISDMNHEQAVSAFGQLSTLESVALILLGSSNPVVAAEAAKLLMYVYKAKKKFMERSDFGDVLKRAAELLDKFFPHEFPVSGSTNDALKTLSAKL